MPVSTRRTRGGAPAKGGQSTLSFNGAASKVTKNAAPIGKDIKKAEPVKEISKPEVLDTDRDDLDAEATAQDAKPEPATSEKPAVAAAVAVPSTLTPEEHAAEKVPHSQVLRYWKSKEAERLAPRIHQEGLSTEEKVLRYFDMSSQYGPCVGISRRKRWLRAHRLGLAPPIEALAVLVKEDRKGTKGVEKAHLEKLLATTDELADQS